MSISTVYASHAEEAYSEVPAEDVHDGRPMRPEYRERGELLSLAWDLGWGRV